MVGSREGFAGAFGARSGVAGCHFVLQLDSRL